MKPHLALALSAALALSGCQTTLTSSNANATVTLGAEAALALVQQFDPSLVAKANASLAKLSGGDPAKACKVISTAVGYANDAAPFIASTQVQQGIAVANAINAVCTNPPTDAASTITTLSTLWAGIQAAATKS